MYRIKFQVPSKCLIQIQTQNIWLIAPFSQRPHSSPNSLSCSIKNVNWQIPPSRRTTPLQERFRRHLPNRARRESDGSVEGRRPNSHPRHGRQRSPTRLLFWGQRATRRDQILPRRYVITFNKRRFGCWDLFINENDLNE